MNLLEQQQSRRNQLLETINNIEHQRTINVCTNVNFLSTFMIVTFFEIMFYVQRILEETVNFG